MGEFVTMQRAEIGQHQRRRSSKLSAGRVVLYLIVAFFAVMFMGPFVWTVGSSLKHPTELYIFPRHGSQKLLSGITSQRSGARFLSAGTSSTAS